MAGSHENDSLFSSQLRCLGTRKAGVVELRTSPYLPPAPLRLDENERLGEKGWGPHLNPLVKPGVHSLDKGTEKASLGRQGTHPEDPRSGVWTELTCSTLMLRVCDSPQPPRESLEEPSKPCMVPDQTESYSPGDQLELGCQAASRDRLPIFIHLRPASKQISCQWEVSCSRNQDRAPVVTDKWRPPGSLRTSLLVSDFGQCLSSPSLGSPFIALHRVSLFRSGYPRTL